MLFRLPPQLAAMFLILACNSSGVAQEADIEKKQKELRGFLDESVAEYVINTNTTGKETTGEIVFRWDNRARGSADGCTALWYDKARRPIAIASVYPWEGNLLHEFDLIDRRAGATGSLNGRKFFNATDAMAIKFKPIPDASTPSTKKTILRLQTKALAKEFSVKLNGWRPDNSDREVLRMLTTPVHLYGSPDEDSDVLAGAIFLFVIGTDPEAALLLEAHRHKDGFRWEYALMAQTSGMLEVKHKDNVIWSKPRDVHHASHATSSKRLPAGTRDL